MLPDGGLEVGMEKAHPNLDLDSRGGTVRRRCCCTLRPSSHHCQNGFTVLSLAAVEQCAQDGGSWEGGHSITLLEDSPHQLFQHRPASANPRLRACGGLTPQTWATTTLSYIREIDLIQSRRTEAVNNPKPKGPPPSDDPAPGAKARRPRFPQKPEEALAS